MPVRPVRVAREVQAVLLSPLVAWLERREVCQHFGGHLSSSMAAVAAAGAIPGQRLVRAELHRFQERLPGLAMALAAAVGLVFGGKVGPGVRQETQDRQQRMAMAAAAAVVEHLPAALEDTGLMGLFVYCINERS
jgi:hypothetical protein